MNLKQFMTALNAMTTQIPSIGKMKFFLETLSAAENCIADFFLLVSFTSMEAVIRMIHES
jgi:hypothetical protein